MRPSSVHDIATAPVTHYFQPDYFFPSSHFRYYNVSLKGTSFALVGQYEFCRFGGIPECVTSHQSIRVGEYLDSPSFCLRFPSPMELREPRFVQTVGNTNESNPLLCGPNAGPFSTSCATYGYFDVLPVLARRPFSLYLHQ